MDENEYFEISRELEIHHAVFYTMWNIGKPIFTETLPTAAVSFDKSGEYLAFEFNPNFWKSLTSYEKAFVISHEYMHVILNHGYRMKDSSNAGLSNMALDLAVNHTLVNNFGFDRERLPISKNLYWVDTVFEDQDIPDDESFEFYLNKLMDENVQKINSDSGNSILDDHNKLGGQPETAEEFCKGLNNTLSDEEKEGLKETIDKHFQDPEQTPNKETEAHQAGTSAGNIWTFAQVSKVIKKKKWETVIKKWANTQIKSEYKDIEQWARTNRRFTFIAEELLLPTEVDMEENEKEENKIEVWFFQDTSGSCSGFRDRFFKAALSLPEDKFDVKMYCFDTKVYETTLESKKLYGFGGTSFSILESYIQKTMNKEGTKYPHAVFVITDGYGNNISPQYPDKWYWFLSTGYDGCIHKDCNIFKLENFE